MTPEMDANSNTVPSGRGKTIRVQPHQVIPFVGMVLVVVFFEIVSGGKIFSAINAPVLLDEIFSIAIGSAGVLFLMSQGSLDFSLGAIVGFAGAVAAIASKSNLALTLPVALLVGAAVGFLNGWIHAKFHVQSFITTLAMSFILQGLTTVVLGSGSVGVSFKLSVIDVAPVKLAVLLVVFAVVFYLFEYTRFGKECRAIGSQEEAARQSGVDVFKVKVLSFITSGLACGLVGFFSIVHACTASYDTGSGFQVDVLNAVLIGGLSLTGGCSSKFCTVVIGSIIMGVIANGMTLWGIDAMTQQLVKGVIFILAVAISFDRKSATVIQ